VKKILFAVVFVWFAVSIALAADAPPTEESIKELIGLTDRGKIVELMLKQMDAGMEASLRQVAGGRKLTPEQEKILAEMRARMVALFKQEMSPDAFEPTMIEIYRKNFTQEEIDGMLKFYKTDSGKALLTKMPIVLQQMMQAMQTRTAEFMPKMHELMRNAAEALKDADPK
jgi:hypothetical protein